MKHVVVAIAALAALVVSTESWSKGDITKITAWDEVAQQALK